MQIQILYKSYHFLNMQTNQSITNVYLLLQSFNINIHYMKILLFAIIILIVRSQLRFRDADMMKKHHYQFNPSNDPINVMLIPHSHDDVGWLKTVDNYYYGDDTGTQRAGVQYTIDTVVTELTSNPNYKFSIVQVAFLYRWWNNANITMRNKMTNLLENGQLEFINMGWCMSDEANPYYQDIIDQMTIGLRWVKQTFNIVPKVAWHIDPFGHQSTNAALFNQMGFNAWFFVRIDFRDKQLRLQRKGMQLIWHPNQYSGIDNSIFCHINYYHYSPPPGYCFDDLCQTEPIKDDPSLQGYNVDQRSNNLVNYFRSMALHYKSNNLLHTIGEDFHYSNARTWYKNFDKLIKYINQRPELGMNIKYSTPSQYINLIHEQSHSFPTKYDDFFPYADNQNSYWTGYFTSRVSLKGFIRQLGRYTQIARTHISLLKLGDNSDYIKTHTDQIQSGIWELEMAMGILQHHDAVAGTAKQKVTNDYFIIGSRALALLNNHYKQIQKQIIQKQIGESPNEIYSVSWNQTAKQWGIAEKLQQGKSVLVNLYNPGAKGIYPIKIRIDPRDILVVGSNNESILGDVICANNNDASDCQLLFNLNFEENSYNYVKLVPVSQGASAKLIKFQDITINYTNIIFNLTEKTSLKLNRPTHKFQLRFDNASYAFKIGYNYYESQQNEHQKSGAYIFRSALSTINQPKPYPNITSYRYAQGSLFTVLKIQGNSNVGKIYLSKTPGYLQKYGFELQTFVDTIDTSDNIGKEVVLTLNTQFSNGDVFYTDSNGLQEQKRKWNYRPQYQFNNTQGRTANYYPINSHISLVDQNKNQKVTVLTDRSQGGTSGSPGQIQIMIHRRTRFDDRRGVGQPLNQVSNNVGLKQIVRHYIVFGQSHRQLQKKNDQRIVVTWSNTDSNQFSQINSIKSSFPVPDDVKLYIRPYTDDTYLLRLHNFNVLESNVVMIPNDWKITEYTLGANQLLSDWQRQRYTWNQEPYTMEQQQRQIPKYHKKPQIRIEEDGSVDLKPFQIRTFIMSK